ncbi:MAG: Lcl domain-containing protein [Sulfuricaulis sp.]
MNAWIKTLVFCFGWVAVATSTAQASLVDRGGGLIYDTDLNITWLADANLVASNTFGVSGIPIGTAGFMTWAKDQSWISAMNAANYLGYNNWRLSTTLQPDTTCTNQRIDDSFGYNCAGSELGHLFYNELGGVVGQSMTVTHNTNYNLFQNIQQSSSTGISPEYAPSYGSSTEFALDNRYAWSFDFNSGVQDIYYKDEVVHHSWPVHPGDVGTVPLPAAAWLFGSGLLGLLGIAKRRNR